MKKIIESVNKILIDIVFPILLLILGAIIIFAFSYTVYHAIKNTKPESQITITETTNIEKIQAGPIYIYKIETDEEIIYYKNEALFVVEKTK